MRDCVTCGSTFRHSGTGPKLPTRGWHLDHIVPLSKGGEHSYENVQATCKACNLFKNNSLEFLTPAQAMIPLFKAEAYA